MRWMRGLALFVAGLVAGIVIMQPSAAQQEKVTGLRLNHVGMNVKDFDESVNFYTKTMGFREAFSFKDKEGKPTLTYLQINRDTFLELAPATATALRQHGVILDDPRTGSSKAPLTNVVDPNGLRLELLEFAPDSLQRKAIDAWK
jgi:hypothetical protein